MNTLQLSLIACVLATIAGFPASGQTTDSYDGQQAFKYGIKSVKPKFLLQMLLPIKPNLSKSPKEPSPTEETSTKSPDGKKDEETYLENKRGATEIQIISSTTPEITEEPSPEPAISPVSPEEPSPEPVVSPTSNPIEILTDAPATEMHFQNPAEVTEAKIEETVTIATENPSSISSEEPAPEQLATLMQTDTEETTATALDDSAEQKVIPAARNADTLDLWTPTDDPDDDY